MSVLQAPVWRWTVKDYENLSRTGVLPEDSRVELLHGEIVVMSPIGYRHAMAVTLLTEFFSQRSLSRGRYLVNTQNPFNLDPWSQPQPDLCLFDPACRHLQRHPQPAESFLVIEVADSTLYYDRTDKGRAYTSQGCRSTGC